MSVATEQDIEQLLSKGLRDSWYAICPSHFVTDIPVSLRRCGYKIVFWRDSEGVARALEDHCPHRGAPLSLGVSMGDRISCAYHGVQVDRHGVAVSVPGSPGCKLEGQKATKVFPLEEKNGIIFAYVGSDNIASPPPLVLPEQLTAPEFSSFPCYAEWLSDYRYAFDNLMDPMHGTFLHKQSHAMSEGSTAATFQTRDTDIGFIFEKAGQKNVNFDWTEFGDTGIFWFRLEIPYPRTGGPGGNFHIVAMCTPISPTKCSFFAWRCRKVQGWQRDAWRYLFKNRLEQRHWAVMEQDRVMLENCEPDARQREILYQHDAGLIRLRRYMKQKAVSQLQGNAASVRKAS